MLVEGCKHDSSSSTTVMSGGSQKPRHYKQARIGLFFSLLSSYVDACGLLMKCVDMQIICTIQLDASGLYGDCAQV